MNQELVKEHGILPTFFPPEMQVSMIAPSDVAEFISNVLISDTYQERIYEINGPRSYSSLEIAKIFREVLNRNVALQQIMPDEWEGVLLQAGFYKAKSIFPRLSPVRRME